MSNARIPNFLLNVNASIKKFKAGGERFWYLEDKLIKVAGGPRTLASLCETLKIFDLKKKTSYD